MDLEVNGGGTARLVHLAAASGVRKVIYSSSGGTVYGEPASSPVTEDSQIAPLSNYGQSKFVGELYVKLFARSMGLDFTIFRYGNVFGPRQDPAGDAGVVGMFAGLMLKRQPCTVDGDGEQKKDYVYVDDVAHANVLALDSASGLVANIGTGVGITVNRIFQVLSRAPNYDLPPMYGPPRPGDVRNFWLGCSEAREQLGWEPRISFEEGVQLTVASPR